ncbi:ORF6N domain-containing protein [bacterium]|nr:ORF6N domain-containing protein [bacterium]
MDEIVNIEDKIYIIRGKRVMLDSDLARLYGVTTKRLNEQMKRNRERFPEDFIFQLSKDEISTLQVSRSQNATLKQGQNIKYLPYAYTEHGAVMLASVLKSTIAVQASIQVVRAFINMRSMLIEYKELKSKVDKLENKYDKHFKIVFDAIRLLMDSPKTKPKKITGFSKS